MALSIYINKDITEKDNLVDLIKDSIHSDDEFEVSYDKNSIRRTPVDPDGRNTAADVYLRSGDISLDATVFYKRPDLTLVPVGELNAAEDHPVFIYHGDVEHIFETDLIPEFVRPLVSNRLNIPKDSFRIENIDSSKWTNGRIKFDITAHQQSEVITGKTHGFIEHNFKTHIIYDPDFQYGLGAPESFRRGANTNRTTNQDSFFLSADVQTKEMMSDNGNKDSELHSALIASYINSEYINIPTDLYEVSEPTQRTDGYSVTTVRIKDSKEYFWFGRYITKQFSPEHDFFVADVDPAKWHKDLQGKITVNHTTGEIIYYAMEGFALDQVTLEESIAIQNGIISQINGAYGLPVDTITLDPEFTTNRPEKGSPGPSYTFRYDNSAVVVNGPHIIKIVYERPNKCMGEIVGDYIDSNNSIGAIQGIKDGWSTNGVEWWEIDAGYVRNDQGEPITDRRDYESSDGRWFFPPPGPRNDKPWYIGWTQGGSFGNDGYKPPRGPDYDPDKDLYTKTPSNSNYKYTDLSSFNIDPALMGYRL